MAPKKKLAHRLLGLCVQYAQPLSFVLYLSALGGFLYLPEAAKRNYLDENALLAGFASSQIRLIFCTSARLRRTQNSFNCCSLRPHTVTNGCRYAPSLSKVQDGFQDIQLASKHPLAAAHQAMHEMHLSHWLQQRPGHAMLHAVVRATRTDGKEAIALVTPVSGV